MAPTQTRIEVRPVTPAIGAEVRGVDLSQPFDPEQWRQIHDAFLRHLVLFFKGQKRLTPEEQIRFGRTFGALHIHPAAPHLEGYPEVFVIHTDKNSKTNNGEWWHSDVSCDEEPPLGSILQLHVLPPCGGDTMFSSMYAACGTFHICRRAARVPQERCGLCESHAHLSGPLRGPRSR